MFPSVETNYVSIGFNNDGFYYYEDIPKPLSNLIKIKRILAENLPFSQNYLKRMNESSVSTNQALTKLVKVAKFNKDLYYTRDPSNKCEKVDTLLTRIQVLAPGYQPRSDAGIAMEMGWQGGCDANQFLNDFRDLIKELQKAKIIDKEHIKFHSNLEIDLLNTFNNIVTVACVTKLSNFYTFEKTFQLLKIKDIIKLTECCLKEDKSNQVLQLILLFHFIGNHDSDFNIFDNAVKFNATKCISTLARNYNSQPSRGDCPLYSLPKNDAVFFKTFELLLEEEDDLDKKFDEVQRILPMGKESGAAISLLNKFREKGLDFTKKTLALRIALLSGNFPVFKALIDNGVDPTQDTGPEDPHPNNKMPTLLILAVEKNLPDFVEALINANVDVNYMKNYITYRRTALNWAIINHSNQIALKLIEAGSVINGNKYNAVETAMEAKNLAIFDKLLEKVVANRHINVERNFICWLEFALQGNDNSRTIFVRKLIETGMNLNTLHFNGEHLLEKAVTVRSGNFEGAKLYLEAGGDINAINSSGDTLLHIAVYSHPSWVEFCIAAGADTKMTNMMGLTALECAVRENNAGAIDIFKKFAKKEKLR